MRPTLIIIICLNVASTFAQQAVFYFNNNTKEEISLDTGVVNGAVLSYVTDRHNNNDSTLKINSGYISYGDAQYAKLDTSNFSFSIWVKKASWPQDHYFEKSLSQLLGAIH